MAIRDFTYLGSPFQQGQGNATVMPQSDFGSAFLKSMEDIKKQRQAQAEAKAKQKAAAEKSFDEMKVDYWIGHNAEFQQRLMDVKNEAVNLRAMGLDLSNMTDPRVAELKKKQIALVEDAYLSKGIGALNDKILTMTPEQRAKVTPKSYQAAVEFVSKPLAEQREAYKKGLQPQLVVLKPIPEKEVAGILTRFSAVPQTMLADEATLKADRDARIAGAEKALRSVLTIDNFQEYDDPATAMEEYIKAQVESVKKTYPDLGKQADLAAKEAQRKLNEELGRRRLSVAERRLANDQFKAYEKASQRTTGDLDEFISLLVAGDKGATEFASSVLVQKTKKGSAEIIDQGKVEVIDATTGMGLKDAAGKPIQAGTKVVKIQMPDGTKRNIAVANPDGTPIQQGVNIVRSIIGKPYQEWIKNYGNMFQEGTQGIRPGSTTTQSKSQSGTGAGMNRVGQPVPLTGQGNSGFIFPSGKKKF